ncbi:MAG: histidine phosphatase family protein [Gemmatimonadaceae bacterium]|nr:histidine phosphatase family protein [Gemmatimonadaceae bacterium]
MIDTRAADALRLHFVRHGSATDAAGRCIGQTDLELSKEGRRECRALARHLPIPATTCISSDLRRAHDTATILTEAFVIEEPRLREMHFGEWEGKTWSQLEDEVGTSPLEWSERWTTIRPPGGESFDDVVVRVREWLAALPRDGGDYLVVAHAGSIRAAAAVLLDMPLPRVFSLALDHCHVSTVELSPRGATLIRWNCAGF